MNKELIINTYEEEILLFKENLLGTFKDNKITIEYRLESQEKTLKIEIEMSDLS